MGKLGNTLKLAVNSIKKTVDTVLAKPLGMYVAVFNKPMTSDTDTYVKEAYDNPFFYTPMQAIIKAFNNADIGVFEKKDNKWVKVDSPVGKWLEEPSFATTRELFQEYYLTWLLLHGGCLLYKAGISRKDLHIYSPDAFKININNRTLQLESIEIGTETFAGDQLKNFKIARKINVEDKIAGVSSSFRSPLLSVALPGDMSNLGFRHQAQQLANSGKRTGILEFKRLLGKEKQEEITEKFNSLGGPEGAGKIASVNGEDFKFTPLDVTPQELDWKNSMVFMREIIAAALGVPIQLISTEGTTYQNVKEFKKKLYSDVVEPELRAYCATMTQFLADDLKPNQKVWYDLSGVEELKNDAVAIIKDLSAALDGKVTINEFRQIVNTLFAGSMDLVLAPIAEELANKILISGAYINLGDLGINTPTDTSDANG